MIRFKLTGDSSDLKKAASEGKKSLGEVRQEFREGAKEAAKWATTMTAAGMAMTVALTVKGLNSIDTQEKLARSLKGTGDAVRALNRAGREGGIDDMEASLVRLNRRLGAVESDGGPAAETMKRLNLSAKELGELDVDERLASIADAIRDTGMSSQEAARHLQQLGFTQAEAVDFFSQGGDAIRAYRKDVDDLGLSLTDIDAAQVEQANDAMGIMNDIVQAVSQKLAVEFAPIITAISQLLEDAARDAQGFGEEVTTAADWIVDAMAMAMNAVDGIKRLFQVVADLVIAQWSTMASRISSAILTIVKAVDSIPGMDMSDSIRNIESFRDTASGVAREAMDNIHDTLNEPLAGENFKEFVAEAKHSALEAAEEIVAAREKMNDNVVALEEVRTQAEIDEINKRLEALRDANKTEEEMLKEKHEQELELIQEALEAKQVSQDEARELELASVERHNDELLSIQERRTRAELQLERQKEQERQSILSSAMRSATSLMTSESKKMFEVGKLAGSSQAAISTYTGAAKALELGWPLGPPAAAAITLDGMNKVSQIQNQSFGGGVSGGGGGGSTQLPQQQQSQQAEARDERNIFVQGVNPTEMFSGQQFIDIINEAQEAGGRLIMGSN